MGCCGRNCRRIPPYVRSVKNDFSFYTIDVKTITIVAMAYSCNRFYLKKAVCVPILSYFLKCYFNDCLAGVAIIAYWNVVTAKSRWPRLQISTLVGAIAICTICGILWEYMLPQVFRHGTSDVWDVAAYVLGGCAYIAWRKKHY